MNRKLNQYNYDFYKIQTNENDYGKLLIHYLISIYTVWKANQKKLATNKC